MEQPQPQQIQRLLWWNRIWLGLLVLTLLTWFASREVAGLRQEMRSLRLSWTSDGRGLAIDPVASDGPFLVTHLVSYGSTEGDKVVAVVPEPIVIIDSDGGTLLSPEAVSKLAWRFAITGEKAPAPVGRSVSALFSRPERSKETEEVYKVAPFS